VAYLAGSTGNILSEVWNANANTYPTPPNSHSPIATFGSNINFFYVDSTFALWCQTLATGPGTSTLGQVNLTVTTPTSVIGRFTTNKQYYVVQTGQTGNGKN